MSKFRIFIGDRIKIENETIKCRRVDQDGVSWDFEDFFIEKGWVEVHKIDENGFVVGEIAPCPIKEVNTYQGKVLYGFPMCGIPRLIIKKEQVFHHKQMMKKYL